jgi:hypothetical protein
MLESQNTAARADTTGPNLLFEPASRHYATLVAETAIHAYIASRNADPKPFGRTKSADESFASIERFCRRSLDVNDKAG